MWFVEGMVMNSGNKAQEVIDLTTKEKCYSPQQLAKILPMTPQTIARQFRGRRGVYEYGSDETLYKRKRKFLLISESAVREWMDEHRTDKK
jgi:hypothetical protein